MSQRHPKQIPNTARQHFDALTQEEIAAAVRQMASGGYTDYTIASATGFAVEQVRLILAGHGD